MRRDGDTVIYTAEELARMRERGESRTDWARVDAMTEEELEAAIAADPDAGDPGPIDRSRVQVGIPRPKRAVHIRLDADAVDWFKAQGKGYQTRINAVLRASVESRRGASRVVGRAGAFQDRLLEMRAARNRLSDSTKSQ